MQRVHHLLRAGESMLGVCFTEQLGHAEIRNLQAARFVGQDVFRLNVAMDEVCVVGDLLGIDVPQNWCIPS